MGFKMSFDKQDFSYAVALMSGQDHTFTVNGPNVRDGLFKDILSTFDGPINVFQVGAIESLDGKFRAGSGWSDIIFGEYILENGGHITVADINLDHLAHSFLIASNQGYPIQIKYGDAIGHIQEGYDIYYLDGADEPLGHQQTLEQFQKIEHTKSLVIVDDVKTKALFLKDYLEEKGVDFELHDTGNDGMMVIDMREKNEN